MWIVQRINEEPVLFQGTLQAGLALVVGFKWVAELSELQMGLLLAFSASVLSLLTRRVVTPVTNPKADDGTPLVPLRSTATARDSGTPQPAS
jgi:hypothetical protein